MTLVCSVTKPYPLLFADLALTSVHRSRGWTGRIPTLGDALGRHSKVGGTRYLTGLVQKIALLNPNLAIGWAGHSTAARTVLKALRARYGLSGVGRPQVAELLAQLNYRAGKMGNLDLDIIGMALLQDEVEIFSFGTTEAKYNDSRYGTVFTAGSGRTQLSNDFNFMENMEHLTSSQFPDELQHGLSRILLHSAKFLSEELMYGGTLRYWFGGGFEIAFPTHAGIKKIDEVTYIFWFIASHHDNKIRLSLPTLLLKFSYLESMLLIRRLYQPGNIRKLKSGRQVGITNDVECYIVSPLWNKRRDVVVPNYRNMQSPIVCSSFIFTEENPPDMYLRIDTGANAVRITEEGNKRRYFRLEPGEGYWCPILERRDRLRGA